MKLLNYDYLSILFIESKTIIKSYIGYLCSEVWIFNARSK